MAEETVMEERREVRICVQSYQRFRARISLWFYGEFGLV
jgi:hypothetical protein